VAEERRLRSRRVVRQMDHFIMALGAAGSDRGSAAPDRPGFLLSLYWFDYTIELGEPAQTGHVAYAWSDGAHGGAAFETVMTDAPELAAGLGERLRPGQWTLAEPERPAGQATFLRRVSQPWGFDFRVTGADGLLIEARWADCSAPAFGIGTARGGNTIATMLTESMSPSARVNGRSYPGRTFPNPIWTPWFGSERGSCIIGLGETIYEPLD
jgi:hypothetical protein